MTQKSLIEEGTVLTVSDELVITEDYTVVYCGIPVGSVKENLSWFFIENPQVKPNDIKQIVYLGNYKWGFKHFTTPLKEFESFNEELKKSILSDLLEEIFTLKRCLQDTEAELYRDYRD